MPIRGTMTGSLVVPDRVSALLVIAYDGGGTRTHWAAYSSLVR